MAPDICPGTGQKPERYLANRSNGATGQCPVCRRSVNVGVHTGLIGKHKARKLAEPSDLERSLLKQIEWAGLPSPEREYRFDEERGWRFDLAWPGPDKWAYSLQDRPVAVEVQGAIWTGGAHGRGSGIERDYSKLNAAQIAGWIVLQYSKSTIENGTAIEQIRKALGA